MKRSWLKKILGWQLAIALVIGLVAGLAGVSLTVTDKPVADDALSWDIGKRTITIGYPADAAGILDYTFDGVDDNVQLQAALDALPATGGRIVIVSANTIQFANATTVTRAIDNVTIIGTGAGTAFAGDGTTSPITAGGNNWVLSGFTTDVTTAVLETAMGATTGWSWENITTSDEYLAYRTDDATGAASWDIPVGRGATYVVAASNAPDHVKAQADYVCDGTADDVEIQAAIDALPAGGGKVILSDGTFTAAAGITRCDNLILEGQGSEATEIIAVGAFSLLSGNFDNWVVRGIKLTGDSDTGNGIHISRNHEYITIEDVIAHDFNVGINVNSCSHVKILRCVSYSNGNDGIYVHKETGYQRTDDVLIWGCESHHNGRTGISTENSDNWTVMNCYSHDNTLHNYHYESSPDGKYGRIINCVSEDPGTGACGIFVVACDDVIINSCIVTGGDTHKIRTTGATVTNCVIRSGDGWAIYACQVAANNYINGTGSGIYASFDYADVHDNQIIGTTSSSSTSGAVGFGSGDEQRCHDNLIKDNYNTAPFTLNATNLHFYDNAIINSTYETITGKKWWNNPNFFAGGNTVDGVHRLGGGEEFTYRKTINYDDASPVTVCDIEDGYAVTAVWVEVVTTFDDTGPQTIDIGDGGDPDGFLANANINLGVAGYYGIEADNRGDYLWDAANSHSRTKVYTGSDTIDATIGAGNSDGTQGQAIVYVKVTRIGG